MNPYAQETHFVCAKHLRELGGSAPCCGCTRHSDGCSFEGTEEDLKPSEEKKDWEESFVEKGADLEHDRWARWQKYMFSKGTVVTAGLHKGDLIIPAEFVDRWFRQIDTPYSELSEPEKESDRKETRDYLPIIREKLKEEREILAGAIEMSKQGWIDEGRNEMRLKNAGLYRQLFGEMKNDRMAFTPKELWKMFNDYAPLFTEDQKKELKESLSKEFMK